MYLNNKDFGDLSAYNVLMVDDVPINLLLVRKMLGIFNFEVRTASDGLKALAEVEARKPDLILLDLMMPGMHGFDVLAHLKENPATADIRVVILSALNTNEDIVKGFRLGAADFITKPIIMEKLVNCVATQFSLIQAFRK